MAEGILGAIRWETEVSGYCRCPGEDRHTHANGERDCRVSIDGAPTIYCFHSSCAEAVAEANLRLRRALGMSPWELVMPGGEVLRSGESVQREGMGGAPVALLGKSGAGAPHSKAPGGAEQERLVIESLRVAGERFRGELFERYRWPMEQILEESPLLVADRDPEEQFRTWLRLWPAGSVVWVGDVYSSGKAEHRTHFRSVEEWREIGPAMGNYTCGSAFKPGSFSRSNENLSGHRFLVVESDVLSRDEVGAVFAYLNRRLHFTLHAVVDTAGKSLHGWFDAPRTKVLEERLKAVLTVFGCDPKVFTYSQPVRVPGAWRDGRLQRLIWLRQ